MPTKKFTGEKAKKFMCNRSKCDRKSQLAGIRAELLNLRVHRPQTGQTTHFGDKDVV